MAGEEELSGEAASQLVAADMTTAPAQVEPEARWLEGFQPPAKAPAAHYSKFLNALHSYALRSPFSCFPSPMRSVGYSGTNSSKAIVWTMEFGHCLHVFVPLWSLLPASAFPLLLFRPTVFLGCF